MKLIRLLFRNRDLFVALVMIMIYGGVQLAYAAARSSPFTAGDTIDPGADAEPCGPLDANCFPTLSNASGSNDGLLSSADWTAFNSKPSTGSAISASYFTSTSTTATSTLAYGLNVESGCIAYQGTCINASSTINVYNVMDYGAKGNGSTDDTAAITRAMAAWATTCGILYFPRGTYVDSATHILPTSCTNAANLNATLILGAKTTIWKYTGSASFLVGIANLKDIIIQGPSTDAPTTWDGSTYGLDMDIPGPSGNIILENVVFRYWGAAGIKTRDLSITYVHIINGAFYNNRNGIACGFKCDSWLIDARVQDNDIGIEFGSTTVTWGANDVRIHAVGAGNRVGILVGGTGTRNMTIGGYLESSKETAIQIGHKLSEYPAVENNVQEITIDHMYLTKNAGANNGAIQLYVPVTNLKVIGTFTEGYTSGIQAMTASGDQSRIYYDNYNNYTNFSGVRIVRKVLDYGTPYSIYYHATHESGLSLIHPFWFDLIGRTNGTVNPWRVGWTTSVTNDFNGTTSPLAAFAQLTKSAAGYTFELSPSLKLGQGTSTPWGLISAAALSTNSGPLLTISTSTASATSTAFYIDSTGKVGIGKVPSYQLDVAGNMYLSGSLTCGGTCGGVTGGTAGMLTSWSSATGLTTASIPNATAFIATSTTDTSIFSGSLKAGYKTANLVTGFVQGSNYQYDTLTTSGDDISSAIESSANVGGAVSNALGLSTTKSYRLTYTYTPTSGTAPSIRIVYSGDGRATIGGLSTTAVSGTNSLIFTPASNGMYLEISVGGGSSTNFAMTDITIQEIGNFVVTNQGTVGVGTSTPWKTFSVSGSVGFDGLTNSGTGGYLCLSASKEVTYSASACGVSSERFKHDIIDISAGLSKVLQMRPVSFIYNEDISPSDRTKHLGFVAEEIDKIEKDLAVYDSEGKPYSVKYQEFIPVLVKAIQEQQLQINVLGGEEMATSSSLALTLVSSVKTAFRNSVDWVFDRITGKTVLTEELCVGDESNSICINREQLAAILSNSGQSGVARQFQAPPVIESTVEETSSTTVNIFPTEESDQSTSTPSLLGTTSTSNPTEERVSETATGSETTTASSTSGASE